MFYAIFNILKINIMKSKNENDFIEITKFWSNYSYCLQTMDIENSTIKKIENLAKEGNNYVDSLNHMIFLEANSMNTEVDFEELSSVLKEIATYNKAYLIYTLKKLLVPGYIAGSWKLIDAEKKAKKYPYTFAKPSKKVLAKLKVGDCVKLAFDFDSSRKSDPAGERMIVEIIQINGEEYIGKLKDEPVFIHDLFQDSLIPFKMKNIFDHDLGIIEPSLVEKYLPRCIVSNKILNKNEPVGFLYRIKPSDPCSSVFGDSGWIILTGNESKEELKTNANFNCVSLGAVLNVDDSFIDFLEAPVGSSYKRSENGKFEELDNKLNFDKTLRLRRIA
jgi:hypothetical protein